MLPRALALVVDDPEFGEFEFLSHYDRCKSLVTRIVRKALDARDAREAPEVGDPGAGTAAQVTMRRREPPERFLVGRRE